MAPPRKGLSSLKEKRADRHSEREKNFPLEEFEIETPKHYTKEAKTEFERQYNFQKESGVLSSADIASLILAFNVYNEATKVYAELLKIKITDPQYKEINNLYVSNVKSFNGLIKQFGVTPTERTKVTELVIEKENKAPNITDVLEDL